MLRNRVAVLGQVAPLDARPVERRRHQRVKVALLGRYMLADKREFPCQTIDMSPGGVALFAPVKGDIGSRVVVYVDQIGRIEGRIVRHLDHGFALGLNVPLIKREKLADQLTWLANRHILDLPEDRRHERIVPRNPRSTLRFEDGREYIVKLIDVSLSGARHQSRCPATARHARHGRQDARADRAPFQRRHSGRIHPPDAHRDIR